MKVFYKFSFFRFNYIFIVRYSKVLLYNSIISNIYKYQLYRLAMTQHLFVLRYALKSWERERERVSVVSSRGDCINRQIRTGRMIGNRRSNE